MQVREIMTSNPATCAPSANLQEVAELMADHDCGEIPVLGDGGKPAGVVTDRDIACRAVARAKDPKRTSASDIMTAPVVTVRPEDSVDDCVRLMEQHQIRRVLVVDGEGLCCGVVSQADIARAAPEEEVTELVRDVSQPTSEASSVK